MPSIEQPSFSRLDIGFARFLSERSPLSGKAKARFESLLMQLSARQAAGHSCIMVDSDDAALVELSGLASRGETAMPLVLENGRLYLQRYWRYEQRLAQQLSKLCRQLAVPPQTDALLERYFPGNDGEIDWQKQAARSAATQAVTLITGGPGTGKTTTVVKILALLQETAERPLHIALAAPTGKAAMRLQESIAANKTGLPCSATVKQQIPEKVVTLHRLLGAKPPSPYFKHNADHPLPYDLVVIDETSMVDLALMSKLVDALKPGARLILLGDKNQLASVESGAVLADLTLGLARQSVELLKSHRFRGDIKALADAVNRQQGEQAWQLLQNPAANASLLSQEPIEFIVEQYQDYLQLMADGADFPDIFAAFNRFQVLCANQRGLYSVSDINARVEQVLSQRKQIRLDGRWYAGRPVMVGANHPALQLYNGDIGLCLADTESDGQLRLHFLRGDGSIKKLLPTRLPACETVFAMTIHKSQGSEFERVLIMLPERSNPVLSKELLYTAITRAKNGIKITATPSVFLDCTARKVQRDSGLADKLLTYTQDS